MTEKPSRRKFLRLAAATSSFGFAGQAFGEENNKTSQTTEPLNDINISDGTRSSNRVRVEIFEKGGNEVLFSRTYTLHGINNDHRPPNASTRVTHGIDISGDGTFVVEATLQDGSSDRVEFYATGSVLSAVEGISVYVYPGRRVKVRYGGI